MTKPLTYACIDRQMVLSFTLLSSSLRHFRPHSREIVRPSFGRVTEEEKRGKRGVGKKKGSNKNTYGLLLKKGGRGKGRIKKKGWNQKSTISQSTI